MLNELLPWPLAIEFLRKRIPKGSPWNTAQWNLQAPHIRARSFFSATVENVRFLERAQGLIDDYLSQFREDVISPDGKTRTKALKTGSRADFVKQMRRFMVEEGMAKPEDFPLGKGDLTDIKSTQRLNLIFDTHTRSAYGFGKWKQGMEPVLLDAFPAAEFVRHPGVTVKRKRHEESEGMIRLKTDHEFWALFQNDKEIGGFEVSWPPYGFNSFMDQKDVSRKKAEKLGLLKPGKPVPGAKAKVNAEASLNDRIKARFSRMRQSQRKKIREALKSYKKDGYKSAGTLKGETVTIAPPPPKAPGFPEFREWLDELDTNLIGLHGKHQKTVRDLLGKSKKQQNKSNRAYSSAMIRFQQATNFAVSNRFKGGKAPEGVRAVLIKRLPEQVSGGSSEIWNYQDTEAVPEEEATEIFNLAMKDWNVWIDTRQEAKRLSQLAWAEGDKWGDRVAKALKLPGTGLAEALHPAKMTATLHNKQNVGVKSAIQQGRRMLAQILPDDVARQILGMESREMNHGKAVRRGFHSAHRNLIKISRADTGQVMHEYMHRLEDDYPDVLARSIAHRDSRTVGETGKKLNSILPGQGYRNNEITLKDDFTDPYTGKIYDREPKNFGEYAYLNDRGRIDRASEVLTMGIQELYNDPTGLRDRDFLLYEHVLETLYLLADGQLR